MTQGKIERYHRSMKNVVKLEKYYSLWEKETKNCHCITAAVGAAFRGHVQTIVT